MHAIRVLLSLFIPAVHANIGLKTTASLTTSCLISNRNVSFVVGRVWKNSGTADEVGIGNIRLALDRGLRAYSYFVPCVTCTSSANGQITDAYYSALGKNIRLGGFFVQVMQNAGSHWSTSTTVNVNYIQLLKSAIENLNSVLVIWSTEEDWKAITGGYTGFQNSVRYVAYTDFDGKADETDWYGSDKNFGGFGLPYMKEYEQTELCGFSGTYCYSSDGATQKSRLLTIHQKNLSAKNLIN